MVTDTLNKEYLSGYSTEDLKKNYSKFKKASNSLIKQILTSKNSTAENFGFLKKLQKISEDDGLIEVGNAFSHGDDGHGYYQGLLMLNLTNLKNKGGEDLLYLMIKYVPSADNGYEWDIKEFSEMENFNFSKALVLLNYMLVFINRYTCIYELERLSRRDFCCCVKTVDAGGISFI